MKTRSIIPSVRFFVTLISCCLCFGGVIHADGVQCRTADIFPPARIGFTQTVVQLPVADAFGPDGNPFESLRQPWYVRIWPDNRVLRILMIGGIIVGIKALFSKKSGTTTTSPQDQQTVQRNALQGTNPLASPPSASAQPIVSGWFYHANGTDFGPFDEAALRQLKHAGVFDPATYIRRADGGNWITYADVFGSN